MVGKVEIFFIDLMVKTIVDYLKKAVHNVFTITIIEGGVL